MLERKGRLVDASAIFQTTMREFRITIAPDTSLSTEMILARKHRLTVYDATYLALALGENARLATLDEWLAKAAAAEGVLYSPGS